MRRLVLALALVTSAVLAIPAHAVDCDARVSDGAGLLQGGATRTAADRLADAGADVRVVTVTSLEGQGNLDNLFRKYLSECGSWRAGSVIKNNLVVLMLSVGERRSIGLYFDVNGPFASLNTQWLRVQNGVKPLLKQNEFDRGLSTALSDVQRIVTAPAPAPPAARPTAEKPPVIVHTAPTDYSGLWRVLAWTAFGGFSIWILILGGRAYGRARERAEKRKAARLRARNEKSVCAAGITDFDGVIKDMDARLQQLGPLLLNEDIGDLPSRAEAARKLIRSASLKWSEVDSGVYNPEKPDLAESEYDRIAEFFSGMNKDIRTARETAATCAAEIARRSSLPDEARRAETAAAVACLTSADAIKTAAAAGYRIDVPLKVNDRAVKAMQDARQVLASRRFGVAIAMFTRITTDATEAARWCAGIPARIAALQENIRKGTERTKKVSTYIKEGGEAFTALSAEFNRSSYESVHRNGTAAIAELDKAVRALASATQLSTMERQQWSEAELAVNAAATAMDQADSLIHSILNRKKHLEGTRDGARQEMEEAAGDIRSAREYIKEHRADVSAKYAAALDTAQQRLDEARGRLKVKWPDWPQIAKLAKAANEGADTVLEKARNEYETAERQRKQAATNLREAKRARSKLREYVQDHRSDISSRNRQRLEDVERRLREAEASSDLAFIIATTQNVADDANDAYRSARSDVDAATPSYSSSSSSGGSSFGGGSSDFGSGGGGGFDFGGSIGGGSSDF
ncbi:MAG TPA: hypothetical protein VJ553_00280 [Candidatus Paceibacterota bacterium]|nr:hypothetical protein [Candidatus Paceibacterota bacterium]